MCMLLLTFLLLKIIDVLQLVNIVNLGARKY